MGPVNLSIYWENREEELPKVTKPGWNPGLLYILTHPIVSLWKCTFNVMLM